MDTGIYVALSKETGLIRDMEATANNIANMTTTGFQSEDLMFSDFLVAGNKQENKVAFANDVVSYRNDAQGTMTITDNPLDVAIQGKGFFVIETPLGKRYTRAGSFQIDPNGVLTTPNGYPVLDTSGQHIVFDESDKKVEIGDDGLVKVDGDERATINVVKFDNDQLLQRVGNTLFSSDATPKPADNFRMLDGALERSNVEATSQLTHMIGVSRSISDTINFINTMYALERKASDTLAKVYS